MENKDEIHLLFTPYVTNAFFCRLCQGISKYIAHVNCQKADLENAINTLYQDPFPFNIIHIHFPEAFYLWGQGRRPSRRSILSSARIFCERLQNLHLSGVKIVWTVHNILSHEAPFPSVDRLVQDTLTEVSDRIILQSQRARILFQNYFPNSEPNKYRLIPHINYIGTYPNEIPKTDAKKLLGIRPETFVFLCIGQIRPYKGLAILFDAFKKALRFARNDVKLIIAGKFPMRVRFKEKNFLRLKAFCSRKVRLFAHYVPDEDLQVFLNASDICVFSYQEVFMSGAVILAESFGLPVIAPNAGCLPDYVEKDFGFLYEKGNIADLAEKMVLAMNSDLNSMGQKAKEFQLQYDPDLISRQHADLYMELLKKSF